MLCKLSFPACLPPSRLESWKEIIRRGQLKGGKKRVSIKKYHIHMQTDIGQLEIVRGDGSFTIFLFSFFFFLFFRFLFECMSLRGYGAQVLLYSLPVAC